MKKELVLFLIVALLILANEVRPQNEIISDDDNETIAAGENRTLIAEERAKEPTRTLLSDCSQICLDKEGCTCASNCEKTETDSRLSCGGKKQEIKEVSICPGCDIDGACLDIGDQILESESGPMRYCSANKKMEKAKETDESCNYDYECLTYNCEDNTCTEILEEKIIDTKLIAIIGVVILTICLVFLTLKLLFHHKKSIKGEMPKKKESFETKFDLPKYKYKYKPEFDILEKKLKESLKKQKNK